ncbi:GDSL esterase/lipase, partial [Trifolium medium]|nr:GDSL esterase/lipase [Trifolium medium]
MAYSLSLFFSTLHFHLLSEKTKQRIRFVGSMLRAGLAIAMNLDKKGYFEHRRKMEEIGAGSIEKIATQNS